MKHSLTTLIGLLIAAPASAAVFSVPGTHATITEAIQAAVDGDTIRVSPGTWEEFVDFRGKAISIESIAGPDKTILSAIPGNPCVVFVNGEPSSAQLKGFTVKDGQGMSYLGSTVGGGIYILESSPTIQDCIIENNEAEFGGGMHIALGSPMISDCLFRNNESVSNGGAVRIHDNAFPAFTDCVFESNHTNDFGGAIAYGNDSTGVHDDCIFEGNTADIRGGAIYLGCSCSDAQVSGSDFCNSVPDHIVGAWSDNGGNDWCPVCEDDINADGHVGVEDLLAIISAWGPCVCLEDINGDAIVDVNDLLLIIGDWGTCPN